MQAAFVTHLPFTPSSFPHQRLLPSSSHLHLFLFTLSLLLSFPPPHSPSCPPSFVFFLPLSHHPPHLPIHPILSSLHFLYGASLSSPNVLPLPRLNSLFYSPGHVPYIHLSLFDFRTHPAAKPALALVIPTGNELRSPKTVILEGTGPGRAWSKGGRMSASPLLSVRWVGIKRPSNQHLTDTQAPTKRGSMTSTGVPFGINDQKRLHRFNSAGIQSAFRDPRG